MTQGGGRLDLEGPRCGPLGVVLRGGEGGPAAAASLSGLPPASRSLPTAVRRRGRRRPRPLRRGDRWPRSGGAAVGLSASSSVARRGYSCGRSSCCHSSWFCIRCCPRSASETASRVAAASAAGAHVADARAAAAHASATAAAHGRHHTPSLSLRQGPGLLQLTSRSLGNTTVQNGCPIN